MTITNLHIETGHIFKYMQTKLSEKLNLIEK